MHRLLPRSTLALAVFAALAAPAYAKDGTHPHKHRDDARTLDTVKVTASPLDTPVEQLARPAEVLTGIALDERRAATLGDTVDGLTGVQNASFGPGVGRPVIRGLDGSRVQVLANGLSSLDASTVSADHAVTIDPFLADGIEVLKGPANLFFGSGAIGGAVNVVDNRIPRARRALHQRPRRSARRQRQRRGRRPVPPRRRRRQVRVAPRWPREGHREHRHPGLRLLGRQARRGSRRG
ncbi:MAG: Plug domain-containing protein [Xanthomonadaceae bacterium]|jgi:iron complex outermembrane receptor protein|nr:Plug domain-containing protein [Xanthomonadaceae bacterium]